VVAWMVGDFAVCLMALALILAKVSHGLGEPMQGLEIATLETRLQDRGW